jgi:hypothetical protein
VRHPNCTHPRGQILADEHVRITREQLAQMRDSLDDVPEDANAIVLGPGLRYEVLECSWCRNPDAPLPDISETHGVVSAGG